MSGGDKHKTGGSHFNLSRWALDHVALTRYFIKSTQLAQADIIRKYRHNQAIYFDCSEVCHVLRLRLRGFLFGHIHRRD